MRDKVLILSIQPLTPVKSGMQNTTFYLSKYLKRNSKVYFFNIKNSKSLVDPIFKLKISKNESCRLEKKIKKINPKFIFINTSKLLYLTSNILLKHKLSKKILVCHDLYYFRKRYFKNLRLKDNNLFNEKKEINCIKKIYKIIDFSLKEKKYLLKQGLSKTKFVYTQTPTSLNPVKKNSQKKPKILIIQSQWIQNIINIKKIINKLNYGIQILIIGKKMKLKKIKKDNIAFLNYKDFPKKGNFIGLAYFYVGTGRKTKIFDMMSKGIPVITNENLSEFGLKKNYHYIFVNNLNSLKVKIKYLSENVVVKNKIIKNSVNWIKKNAYYVNAFKNLNKILKSA